MTRKGRPVRREESLACAANVSHSSEFSMEVGPDIEGVVYVQIDKEPFYLQTAHH